MKIIEIRVKGIPDYGRFSLLRKRIENVLAEFDDIVDTRTNINETD